jgi:hypothetical protein
MIDVVNSEALGKEQMLRISYVMGIDNGLHIYWGDELADRWTVLGNTSTLFGGESPFEYMIRGGLGAMRTVRDQIDAWCAVNQTP